MVPAVVKGARARGVRSMVRGVRGDGGEVKLGCGEGGWGKGFLLGGAKRRDAQGGERSRVVRGCLCGRKRVCMCAPGVFSCV